MPVTAKLSKLFYERLGEQVANELVEWFNSVDATYRTDLREFNELNFARFDAKLDQRLSEFWSRFEIKIEQRLADLIAKMDRGLALVHGKMDRGLAEVHGKMDRGLAEVHGKMDRGFAEVHAKTDQRFAEVHAKMDQRFAEVNTRFADVRTDMAALKAELIKWMFLFWAGTALAGLLLR